MASFSDLMKINATDSHTYNVNLLNEWSIGSVPHGGAVTSVLQSVARQHFLSTLRSQNQPDCIILHADFVQRTSVGPAVVRVKDVKLGRQTSTVQLTLMQDGRDEVLAVLTHSNLALESGLFLPTSFNLSPKPPAADLKLLSTNGADGDWIFWPPARPDFRKAATNVDIYLPKSGRTARGIMDQWIKFKNGERFTNLSLGLLSDMFPLMVESYVDDREAIDNAGITQKQLFKHWYPTLALNLDVKKLLPADGLEWMFVRIQAKVIANGRKDLEVVIMDEKGGIVALSHHVAMIVSDARNTAKRGQGKQNGSNGSNL